MARSRRGGDRDGGKVTPNLPLDPESTRVLNLSVLRRLDHAVTDILFTAGHVVAYSFDDDIEKWSRKPVEGPLFVVKRSEQPRFQLVVMNRLNTENLVEDLLTDFEYDLQVPYLMYRNAEDEIIGIWFYDPQECHEVAHLFRRIGYAFSRASPKANHVSKSDFEELEVTSTHSAEDTLEQSTSPTIVPDGTKKDLLAAFSRAASCEGDTIGGAARPHQSFHTPPSHQLHRASALQTSALRNLLPSRTSSVHMRPFDANISHNSASCEGDTIGGTGAARPHQSFHTPPSHQLHSASASQTSALHNLLPSRTSSVHMRPFDANIPHNSATIQPSCLAEVNPSLLPPMTSTQTTMDNAASSLLSVLPPLHPPIPSHQPQSVPLHYHPFPLPMPSPPLLTSMPLLQPFPPPPKPSPLLTPTASYVSALTRDQVKDALLRLVQNDCFIDVVYRGIAKRPYP